jgi:membrane-bound lytic murein transglycosylase B
MKNLLACLLLLLTQPVLAESFGGRTDVKQFISEMVERHGFEREALEVLFARTRSIPSVIRYIMPPKDPGIRSWQAYRGRFVEPRRIAAGRHFMHEYRTNLAQAEALWGVPREIISAIIGVETIYGRNQGKFGVFAALATLAFDYPPRAELFRRELGELLLLAREEGRDVLSYRGSYAGAMGLPQFLPSSRRKFAIDFDGSGRIDLASSAIDAIGSVANYLAQHGWQRGQPIAEQTIASGDGLGNAVLAGLTPSFTPGQWRMQNVDLQKVGAGETALHDFPALPAALIDLVTPDSATEYRLGYQNFYVITRYNRSSFYAASVMDLAAELGKTSQ